MSDILADYREWREGLPLRIGTHSDRCHMYHEKCMIHKLAREVERLRRVLSQGNSGTETASDCHLMAGPEIGTTPVT